MAPDAFGILRPPAVALDSCPPSANEEEKERAELDDENDDVELSDDEEESLRCSCAPCVDGRRCVGDILGVGGASTGAVSKRRLLACTDDEPSAVAALAESGALLASREGGRIERRADIGSLGVELRCCCCCCCCFLDADEGRRGVEVPLLLRLGGADVESASSIDEIENCTDDDNEIAVVACETGLVGRELCRLAACDVGALCETKLPLRDGGFGILVVELVEGAGAAATTEVRRAESMMREIMPIVETAEARRGAATTRARQRRSSSSSASSSLP